VLLKIDFPRQTPQAASERERNEALAQKYRVTGFPTIVVLRPNGTEKGRLGYRPGGPGPWLSALNSMP
jgi:protein disulfide-isomerase